jgi:hypothetical protein
MATILQPIDFTDKNSKDSVSGDNSSYYIPFVTTAAVKAASRNDILTGVTSGATIKVLSDVTIGDTEIKAKVLTGDPAEAGEVWQDSGAATVATGTGGIDEGRNVYLRLGDEYYEKLLRDFGILTTDTDLADPPIFQVKRVLMCFVEIEIFGDLIDDARAPYETQEILVDKFRDKRKYAQECHDKWLAQLDENAFYDDVKSTDSPCIGTFGRR